MWNRKVTTYEVKFKIPQNIPVRFDAVKRYGRIHKLKEGDLLVRRANKALYCSGDRKYRKRSTVQVRQEKKFLLLSQKANRGGYNHKGNFTFRRPVVR